jgi:hypothetical protein
VLACRTPLIRVPCARTQSDLEVVLPTWETTPNGVVSLLTMLEFFARDYVQIAYEFGVILTNTKRKAEPKLSDIDLSASIGKLMGDANRLGLLVTREALGAFITELATMNPGTSKLEGETIRIRNAKLDADRVCYHLETIYETLKAELRTTLFKVVPKEKVKYNDSEWLKSNYDLQSRFPTAFRELERGGICYSLGQPTASVFHSMRALESGLCALAKPFQIPTTLENWNTIIEQIEKAVRGLGAQAKSQLKSDDEKFYGAAAAHLYFVKNAWRNHVTHRLENYSDDDALKTLLRTQEFTESLCARLQE